MTVENGVAEDSLVEGVAASTSRGQAVLHPSLEQWLDTASALKDAGFDLLVDLTAVDYLTYAGRRSLPEGITPERFEVVAGLLDRGRRRRVRLRAQVSADSPSIASLFELYPGSEALEREVFDMFGVDFVGHPDMSRILMPEDWVGHPLRKDYEVGAIPVQFSSPTDSP